VTGHMRNMSAWVQDIEIQGSRKSTLWLSTKKKLNERTFTWSQVQSPGEYTFVSIQVTVELCCLTSLPQGCLDFFPMAWYKFRVTQTALPSLKLLARRNARW
jgi:hypothetical protein